MVERRGIEETLVWTAIGVPAAAACGACFLPAFDLRIEALIGAGDEQLSFDYTSRLSLADLRPVGLLALVAAAAILAVAVAALLRGARAWLVVVAFVLAWSLGLIVYDVLDERLEGEWSESGVIGYEEPHGGPLLQPALDDLKARARRSPEAQEPGWELLAEHGYAARGLSGWRLFAWSVLALFWLTAYRLARLWLTGPRAACLVAGASVVLLFVWVWRGLSELG
jgi:hypothetical protein